MRNIEKLAGIGVGLFVGFAIFGVICFQLAGIHCNGSCYVDNPEWLDTWNTVGLFWIFGVTPYMLITGIIMVFTDKNDCNDKLVKKGE